MRASPSTPPTTPPAIAPVLLSEFAVVPPEFDGWLADDEVEDDEAEDDELWDDLFEVEGLVVAGDVVMEVLVGVEAADWEAELEDDAGILL